MLEFSELEKMDETTLVWMKHSPNNLKRICACFSRLEAENILKQVYGYFKHIDARGAFIHEEDRRLYEGSAQAG